MDGEGVGSDLGSLGQARRLDADVVVVGAGPTGLFAAALLARCGVRLRIIDKSPSQVKESRAFAVQARTLEIFHAIGLAEAFLDRGTLASGARIYVDGKPGAGFNFEDVGRSDTPFPLVMILPQSETEAILVDDLSRLGIHVERGVTATALTQDSSGVTVSVTDPDGMERALSCSFLIGADGAHSVVRKALGLTFEGAPYAQTFLLADCALEGELEQGPFSVFFHRENFALWFPINGSRFGRVITTSRQEVTDSSVASVGSSPTTLAEVEESLRAAANRDLRLTDPVWLSRYRVHHRGVNSYGTGRVFVAGDAAHIHSPAGGQGMNTGLQDVFNLAWKLALSVRQGAPRELLASYDSERRPVGENVLAATDRVFSFVTSNSPWVSAVRNTLLPLAGATIGRSGMLRSRAFHLLSELGIHYGPGAAVQDEKTAPAPWSGGPAPGDRVPDARISRTRTAFDLLAGYRFQVLAICRKALSLEETEAIADELQRLPGATGLDLGAQLIANSLVGRHPRLIRIEHDTTLSSFGMSDGIDEALYLVRPDGHVAWRSPSLDFAGLRSFVAGRFRPPSAS